MLTLCLSTTAGFVNLLGIYALTLCSTPEAKDQFYETLDEGISRIPNTEGLYLLGDFNARMGADCNTCPSCLGYHGTCKMNENGQRLLEMCCQYDLCLINTYFNCKDRHKVSWRHPRSGHWHQLDLVITRRADLGSFIMLLPAVRKESLSALEKMGNCIASPDCSPRRRLGRSLSERCCSQMMQR
jgi:hypothetical protein